MQTEKFSFFNLPREFNREHYKRAIDYILDKYYQINNLASIYNWGDPSAPGISDIDLVLVLKDNSRTALPFLKRSFYFLNSKTRYLVRHPFMFIDENSFRDLRYVYPNTNLKLLFGKELKIKELSENETYYSCISLLNDIIVRHYPRDFIEQQINQRINVRDTMLRLNSLKHSIKTLSHLTKSKYQKWCKKLELIEGLRRNWFKSNDFELLIGLNKDALDISLKIIKEFTSFLKNKGIVKIHEGSNVYYNGIKNKTLFIRNWNKNESLKRMSSLIRRKEKFYSILPIELAAQQFEYCKSNGLISNYIRRNLSNSIGYDLKHKRIIEERIEVFNNQAKLALELKHSDFAAFFDFGYRSTSGINNMILNLLDKVRF